MKEGLIDGRLSVGRKDQALLFLRKSGSHDQLVDVLTSTLEQIPTVPPAGPGLAAHLRQRARRAYLSVLDFPWFQRLIVVVIVVNGLFFIALFLLLALSVIAPSQDITIADSTFDDRGGLVSSIVAGGMALIGATRLVRDRLAAYRWFRRSMLVSLFLVQFFAFYTEQLAALTGLALDLIILATLDRMIAEAQHSSDAAPSPDAAALGIS
jgi:hypothetical protein